MAKILFAAHDPGGANMIVPMIERAKTAKHDIAVRAIGPAIEILPGAIAFENGGNRESLEHEVASVAPDLVVSGTSMHANLEKNLWQIALEIGCQSMAFVDSWSNFEHRFSLNNGAFVFPNDVCVPNTCCQNQLKYLLPPNVAIHVVGQPHLERRVAELTRARASRLEAGKSVLRNIVFFSEPFDTDYGVAEEFPKDQFDVVRLLSGIVCPAGMSVSVKPHPRESTSRWRDYLGSLNIPIGERVTLLTADASNALVNADVAVSISSMVLIEATFAGIPALAYQPGGCCPSNALLEQFVPVERSTDPGTLISAIDRLYTDTVSGSFADGHSDLIQDAVKRSWGVLDTKLACVTDE